MVPSLQSTFSPVLHPEVFNAIRRNHKEMRMNVHAHINCWDQVARIPKAIGTFFAHRYADLRMFIRACFSISGASRADFNHRIAEINRFKFMLEGLPRFLPVPQIAAAFFPFQLSAGTRDLFYYVDIAYMQQFTRETDPAKIESMRQEIVRECDRAIHLQEVMSTVHSFFASFSWGLNRGQRSAEGPGPQVSPGTDQPPFATEAPGPHVGGAGVPGGAPAGINLNIPGTIPYVQNNVPAEIQTKGAEIARLVAIYERMRVRPPLPEGFECVIMKSIMEVPVFDASHPAVQNGLPALRTALDTGGPGAAAALKQSRNLRHLLDGQNLEQHISSGSSWAPAKCPQCRHPEHMGILRENLRIDTTLQDEILGFLRANVVVPVV